ncbi:MAG: TonB-dependent receptor [Haliscomenobacter sp.]|uniref:TonB-dependent receptor n=1 Tax=Haliscomenobacter sp. TaxID=2717303 RepID=UPI0029A6C0A1|nr:TonB-dependent receptor [Haliscomenobacter sp.]MDX2070498.1 TonB-dependent receptor [Haliscomenobacter sp.]
MKHISPLLLLFCLLGIPLRAQVVLRGQVQEAQSRQALVGASVLEIGSINGTATDSSGYFELPVVQNSTSWALEISMVGFRSQTIQVTQPNKPISVRLEEDVTFLNTITVAGSRIRERIINVPVSLEFLDRQSLQNVAASSFYDALENVKGLQMATASLGFKVPNTRGFMNTTNVRFIQLVDGADNQAPHIGSPIANALGPTELDINRVELIPGVSSALYGMNALNGMLQLSTKSPFEHTGLSLYQRTGLTHLNNPLSSAQLNTETNLRWAQRIQKRWAYKVNFGCMKGQDWIADDQTDLATGVNASVNLPGGPTSPAFDPVNGYGNERSNRRTLTLAGKNYQVARTGYYEREVTDYFVQNLKGDFTLGFRPREGSELSYTYRIAEINNVYQRSNRFNLRDYLLQQHQIRYRSGQLTTTAYVTLENTGKSYNLRSMGENMDRQSKTDDQWFAAYRTRFPQALAQDNDVLRAHNVARAYADSGRLVPGTPAFATKLNQLADINNWDIGAALRVVSRLYHAEAQYNFSPLVKSFDLLLGAEMRQYEVIPDGNYFVKPGGGEGNLLYGKMGGFVQVADRFFANKLKISATLRLDKNQYFKPVLNPRLALLYNLSQNNSLRVSWQEGYRFPSLFEGFSNINSGGVKRVGGLPIMSKGLGVFENSYLRSSADAFVAAVNNDVNRNGLKQNEAILKNQGLLKRNPYTYLKPEYVSSYEIGYKGIFAEGNLLIDADFYFNAYQNFMAQVEVNLPLGKNVDSIGYYLFNRTQNERYRVWTNSTAKVFNYGGSLGIKYLNFFKSFNLNANVSYAKLNRKEEQDGLEESFNTPEWMLNASVSNPAVFKQLGFNLSWRWQSFFLWQSFIANGNVPAYQTLDGHLTFNVPDWKMSIKVGGSNLLNRYYIPFIAGPSIGGHYYLSLRYGL